MDRLSEEALASLNGLLEGAGVDSIKADMRQYDYFFCVLENILGHGLKQGTSYPTFLDYRDCCKIHPVFREEDLLE